MEVGGIKATLHGGWRMDGWMDGDDMQEQDIWRINNWVTCKQYWKV
jgi:hypothetical protein